MHPTRFLLAACMLTLATFSAPRMATAGQALEWPAITNETKPWSRWWWLGNITTEEDLRVLMSKYAEAGLGGLEVTPIYGVRGYEKQFIPFLAPDFVDRLEFAAREAKRHGMAIDMSTGTGWPFGGPWVDDSTASRYLASRTFTVAAGGRLAEPVALEQRPFLRFAGATRVDIGAIKQPVSANENLQELAIDQVRFARPLPLHTLMAFPGNDVGQGINLTRRVGSDGMLNWTAPADGGEWTLYAVFNGWHGKMVERAGPGGEGMAIDHFSSGALERYLAPFDAALKGRKLEGFRGWFNDSYEVDDAMGESNFTEGFFEEFERRRGYDLRQHLPWLLAGNTAPGWNERMIWLDYKETISDLLLDEFTVPWRAWAQAHGKLMRNQAHGSPANIIDLYAASDIPETEGSDILQFKTASSAAHLAGKPLASAEALTWLDEHWLSSLGDARRAVDGFFLGGINHICYHGTVYSPPADPWPGFRFYAAVEFDPSNPLWEHFGALNAYVTRAQSFLQRGRADEGLLVYYNIHDRWSELGFQHFHGAARDGMTAHTTGEVLLRSGYGFDFITDRLLKDVTVDGTSLKVGASAYTAIVVPPTRLMPLETMERLAELARAGAPVYFDGPVPSEMPGFRHVADPARTERFEQAGRNHGGNFHSEIDLVRGLARNPRVVREAMVDRGLRFVRRIDDEGVNYFIVNMDTRRFDGWVPLSVNAQGVALFDPLLGTTGVARSRAPIEGRTDVRLQLDPGQSIIVRAFKSEVDGPVWSTWEAAGSATRLNGEWSLTFLRGGPTLPAALTTRDLKSWTELGGDDMKAFSGTGRYAIEFDRPSGNAVAYALDLGRVEVSARVTLNGTELGTVFDTPHRLVVPATAFRERNTLEIDVVSLAANRIADLDRRGVSWKKFYNVNMPAWRAGNRGPDGLFSAANWEPRVSGLLGPVTLTPLKTE